jgi:amphi-Trp domain-containing protein
VAVVEDSRLVKYVGRIYKAKPMKKDRDEERIVAREKFAAVLRRAAEALESGKSFVIQVRGERIRVPKDAELSVEHEREGKEEELELQFKWKPEATGKVMKAAAKKKPITKV